MIAAALGVCTIVAYLWAVRAYGARFPQRRYTYGRIAYFVLGVALTAGALLPPADAAADGSLAAHMVQHIVLTLVGPPLVLLGAPLLLCVSLPPPRVSRAIAHALANPTARAIFAPLTGWCALVAALWVTHFSPLYEAALEHEWIHVTEHGLFVATAMLFWMAIVQVGYAPHPLAFPARMLYVFLAIPQGAFLGLAVYAAGRVLYPHYALGRTYAQAMSDQRAGGEIMWVGGGLILFAAFMIVAGVWAARERSEATA